MAIGAALFTGCSAVEFVRLPDAKYLDRSDYFVGTVTIQGKDNNGSSVSSSLLFGEPQADGRRRLIQSVRLADDVKSRRSKRAKKDDLFDRTAYLYNIEGIRYLLFVQEKENRTDHFTPVRVSYRKRKLSFEIPDFSKFKKHWPHGAFDLHYEDRNIERIEPVFDGDSTQIAEALGDRELSNLLFEGSVAYVVDTHENTLVFLGPDGKPEKDDGKIEDARIAMLLPGQLTRNAVLTLLIATIATAAFVTVIMTGKLLLDDRLVGSATVDFQPKISKRVLIFGSVSATLLGGGILVVAIVFSGSLDSLTVGTLLPIAVLFTMASVAVLWAVERFGDWTWEKIVGYRLRSEAADEASIGAVVGSDADILRFGAIAGVLVGFAGLVGCSFVLGSSEAWAWRVVLLVLVTGVISGTAAGWLTIQNEPLVRLVNSALRAETAKRAIGPCFLSFLIILPGLALNHWVSQTIMSWVDTGLSHEVDVVMPGVTLMRPIVRQPTMEDGLIVFLLGVPQVEMVEWSTDEQQFNMRTPSPWRETVLSFLKLLGAIATCVLLLLMARLFVGIFLRVAATSRNTPVTYQPSL
ncbi:hypothetical protein CGZ80_27215 [Rhodopirellula sp. MGV]|nr:hypothetical protein CGZ80_27215 [Rhodopirellula sp. MGV]PNY38629.1 hypothetical protein C2E31_01555 [Rhodopirellula baltica]